MSDQDRQALLYKSLEQFPPALNTDQVAQALGVQRRTAERLLEGEAETARIKYFLLDDTKSRGQKRVTKATLVEFMLSM